MVTGTNNCPFCDEEVYCIGSLECVCSGTQIGHWPFYEQYKCPHCGIFNMCIDRRHTETKQKLYQLQAIASEENIQSNQNEQYNFWLDQPVDKVVCNPEIKKAIKKGLWVVKSIHEYQ